MFDSPTIWVALAASGAAGLATGVGALPAVVISSTSERARSAMSGFSAGVMLAAAVFTLILPGISLLTERGDSLPVLEAGIGVLVGAAFIDLLNRWAPHEHFVKGPEGSHPEGIRRVWLFVIAITLHNIPEGLAVGVGVATGDPSVSIPVTIGIGLQNMPEGLIVALALRREGYGVSRALLVALLTGLVEPVGSAVGFGAVALMEGLLPFALAFSGGAMLYVVSGEIIPESHRSEFAGAATWGTMGGFVGMMVLEGAIG
jgi:zinc transporter, ZIP family